MRRHHSLLEGKAAQAGFTLVEMLTVLILMSVLAAVALPRFGEVQSRARQAKVAAAAGGMRATSGMVKAAALAAGLSCTLATAGTLSMEGAPIALNYCYPQALNDFDAGVLAAANVHRDDGWLVSNIAGENGGASPASVLLLQLADSPTPTECGVFYTAAAGASTPATVGILVSGC